MSVIPTRLVHPAPLAPARLTRTLAVARGVKAAAGRGGARKGAGSRPTGGGGGGEGSEEPLEQLGSAAGELQASLQEGAESVASAAERAAADVQKEVGGVADAALNVAEDAADTAADALSGAVDAAAASVAPPPKGQPAAAPAGSPSRAVEPRAEPLLLPEVPEPLLLPEVASNGSHAGDSGSASSRADVEQLKQRVIAAVAGLDRGVAATKDDGLRVENLVLQLESAGGPVVLGALPTALEGRWRLIYSSAFSSGSLGGARPGPPTGVAPLTLGPVFQDIRVGSAELDNVVQLSPKFSLASLPGVDAKPPTLTLRLKHKFEVSAGNAVRVTFEKTVVKASGGLFAWLDSLPEIATPELPEALRPRTSAARGATFDVTFVDEGLRVTRGDRGEVRIFLKEPTPLF